MSSSTNAIKTLVQRFLSLPIPARMQLTKKLLESYSSDHASRETGASQNSCGLVSRKNFLEEFWDRVEEAHADDAHAVNPFREERKASARTFESVPEADQQSGYLPLIIHHSKLLPLL
ncbi:MAG TPA: hypothetical protein VM095_00790 [Pyrinomonadaceae bacterium]|nr:hypothetical protein [Pyrinomonadaceae bacterium]